MHRIVRYTAAVLLVTLVSQHAALAVGSKKAAYFGGTLTTFGNATKPVEGRLDTGKEDALIFIATHKPYIGERFAIPYASIIDLEYGQKAGRRVGAAAATTVLLGPVGLLTLFSKKRKHFLTIGFKDESGKDQVAVMELGKDIVRTTLAIVQTRSGQEIEYQDDEARKSAK
jgi:hypothetical protein